MRHTTDRVYSSRAKITRGSTWIRSGRTKIIIRSNLLFDQGRMIVGEKTITGLHRTSVGWSVSRGTLGSVMVEQRSFEVRARFLVAERSPGAVLRISERSGKGHNRFRTPKKE